MPVIRGIPLRPKTAEVDLGMPGFPPTEQWNLLGLVNADTIGVNPTASGVLVPRKSTSMVIGTGSQMTRWTQAEVCARCSLEETCHYKVPRREQNDCFDH